MIVDKNGVVKERNDYYAFGAKHVRADYPQSDNRYDYNGKEEQTTGNLKYLDYGARFYDSELGRWNSIDPMAEMYLNQSTYHFTANSPINFIDRNGMHYYEGEETGAIKWFDQYDWKDIDYMGEGWKSIGPYFTIYHMDEVGLYYIKYNELSIESMGYLDSGPSRPYQNYYDGGGFGYGISSNVELFWLKQGIPTKVNPGTITAFRSNWFGRIKRSGFLGRIAYDSANDISVSLQSLVGITYPANLDGSIVTPREKLESGINGLMNVLPSLGPLGKGLKTANAGQFNKLGIKLANGKTITAATDAGMHIRQYNCVMRNMQGVQHSTKTFGRGYTFFQPMVVNQKE